MPGVQEILGSFDASVLLEPRRGVADVLAEHPDEVFGTVGQGGEHPVHMLAVDDVVADPRGDVGDVPG